MDTSQHNVTSWRRGEVPSHWPDRHSPVVASPPSVVVTLDEDRFRVVRASHGDVVLDLDPRQREALLDADPVWITRRAVDASPRRPSAALEAALRSASADREPIVNRDAKDRCDASGLIDLNALARMTGEKPPAVPLTPTVKRRRPTKPPIAPSPAAEHRASFEARVPEPRDAGISEAPACERPQISFDADAPDIVIDETTQSFVLEPLDEHGREPTFDDRGDTVLEHSFGDEPQRAHCGSSRYSSDHEPLPERFGHEPPPGRYSEHSFGDAPLVANHLESEVAHDPRLPLMLDLDGRRAKLAVALADTDRFGRVMAAPGGGDGDGEDDDLPFDLDLDADDALAIEELGDGDADDVVGSGRLDVDLRASTPVSRADATFVQRATDMFSRTVRRVMVPLLAVTLLVLAMGGRWSFAGSATTRTYAALHANDGSAGAGSAGTGSAGPSGASSRAPGTGGATGSGGSAAGTGSAMQAPTGPGNAAITTAVHTFKVGRREMSGKININTASEDELQLLPTVGPSKAERIVTWRKKNGGFKRPADLRRVKGFGYKTYKKLEPFLDIKGDTTLAAVK